MTPNSTSSRAFLALAALLAAAGVEDAQAAGECAPQAYPQGLSPGGLTPNARYGNSVALGALVAIVGAPDHNSSRGAIVTHRIVNGAFDAGTILSPPSLAPGDRFGESVVLSGDLLYVGAPGDDSVATEAGAVYVYQEKIVSGVATWSFVNELHGIQSKAGDHLGTALAAEGYTVVAGAPDAGVTHVAQGKVFVFQAINQNWMNYSIQNLLSSTPQVLEHFGNAVALEGNSLLIGARDYDMASPFRLNAGRAFVFTRPNATGSWTKSTEFNPGDAVDDRRFGAAVDISGGVFFVGAPGTATPSGKNTGGVYTYVNGFGFWIESSPILSEFAESGQDDEVGLGIAVASGKVYVSSNKYAYEFQFDPVLGGYGDERHVLEAPFAALDPLKLEGTGSALAASSLFVLTGRASTFPGDVGRAFPFWRCGGSIQSIGGETTGTLGAPQFGFAGPQAGGLPLELRLKKGKPSAVAMLAIHAGMPNPIAFHGGMLKAFPIQLMLPIAIDPIGEFKVAAVTPPGIQDIEFVIQVLIPDSKGKGGVTLSPAIDLVTAP